MIHRDDFYSYKNWNLIDLLNHKSTKHYWTFQTLDCQARRFNCNGCFCNDFMQQRGMTCQCKKIIAHLIKLGIKPSPTMLKEWQYERGYVNGELKQNYDTLDSSNLCS